MDKIIKEISNTSSVVIENKPVEKDFHKSLKLRKTHTVFCIYCFSQWGDIIYEGMDRNRVCNACSNKIKLSALQKRKNLHISEK